jgi:hypothetical protein
MPQKTSRLILLSLFLLPLTAGAETTPSAGKEILALFSRPADTHTSGELFLPAGASRGVIIIEDAHTHASIQTQIIEIIRAVHAQERADSSGSEPLLLQEGGTFGPIDTRIHKTLAPQAELARYLDEKLSRGEIGAAEYLHTLEGGFSFFGIEDTELYEANYEHFIEIARLRPEIKTVLADFEARFANLRELVFTDELKTFYTRISDRDAQHEDLDTYLHDLRLHALQYEIDLSEYPALNHYFEARAALNALEADRLKAELERYNALSAKHVSFARAHTLSEDGRITVTDYPTLFKYGRLNALLAATRMIAFVKEKERLEQILLEKIAYTDEEKELLTRLHQFAAIKKIVSLTLTREESVYYADSLNANTDPARQIIVYLKSYFDPLEVTLPLSELIIGARAFYDVVNERDRVLSENIARAMERHDKSFATVVIGGFHTTGITEHLKKKGIAFLVVQPTVSADATLDSDTYYDIMQSFWQTRE